MNENFQEILRNYVSDRKKKNPSTSENSLSREFGVSSTTFNRLLNGYSEPSLETILKISRFVPEVEKFIPRDLRPMQVATQRRNFNPLEESVETLLYDKYSYLCWVLSFSEKGITEKEVQTHFGELALDGLKSLEENKIIKKNEKGYYKVIDRSKDTILSFKLIKNHLMFLVEQYKPSDSNKNYVHCWTEFLNEKGMKKVMYLHQEMHRKIQEVLDDDECKGDIPVFSIGCSDRIGTSKQKGDTK